MSHLMPLNEKAVVPVLLLLFHRIEQRLQTNARTLIAIEEAWLYLGHSTFAPRLREWLKTLRKMHAGVVFVTQNLSDVFNSPLCDPILESCKTKILLPNVEAERATTDFYRKVGMTEHQIARLAQATPKRHYWFQGPDGCGMIDLALTPEELAVVGAGSADDIALTRTLQARYSESWPAELFRLRGMDAAAERWRSLDRVLNAAQRARAPELAIA
jgi:type IV secretory pathway VirB4 component